MGGSSQKLISWVKFSGINWIHDNKGFSTAAIQLQKERILTLTQRPAQIFIMSSTTNSWVLINQKTYDAGKILKLPSTCLESVLQMMGSQQVLLLTCLHFVMGLKVREKNELLPVVKLIDTGSVHGISARREDSTVFIGFTSFVTPGVIYQCNLDNEITVPGFDCTDFHVDQLITSSKCFLCGIFNSPGEFPSKDGTETPMLVVAANIRGGGEYGEEWHKAGSLSKKQTCFDDFMSAVEYLVSSCYTQPRKLCIEGGSNVGLLIGACVNQRPDLFGCAPAHVSVMDMLRFHKFTIGHAWTSDYGCSDK